MTVLALTGYDPDITDEYTPILYSILIHDDYLDSEI